jgi:hypothetical protein
MLRLKQATVSWSIRQRFYKRADQGDARGLTRTDGANVDKQESVPVMSVIGIFFPGPRAVSTGESGEGSLFADQGNRGPRGAVGARAGRFL